MYYIRVSPIVSHTQKVEPASSKSVALLVTNDRVGHRLQERLTQLRQAPHSAVSCKDFSAPSEHDYEVLRSLYAVKRDATALGSRDSEQAFFGMYVETVSTLRETVLPATCKAYKLNNGDICGAGLHGDTNENIRHCGKHSARSAW
eukprot:450191-Prorocentrum_minimum.AAC.1